jgi:hypothetical protein
MRWPLTHFVSPVSRLATTPPMPSGLPTRPSAVREATIGSDAGFRMASRCRERARKRAPRSSRDEIRAARTLTIRPSPRHQRNRQEFPAFNLGNSRNPPPSVG